MEEKHNVTQFK